MRRSLLIGTLFFLFGSSVVAAEAEPAQLRTGRYLNGRAWRSMDTVAKSSYLFGLQDGYRFSGYNNGKPDAFREFAGDIAFKVTPAEVREQIDLLYSDSANVLIPVPAAFGYALRRLDGTPSERLNQILAELRRAAIDAQ